MNKEKVSWEKTADGRRTASTRGNNVNLCRYCADTFPECPAIDVVFGDGVGNDNVAMCASYRHLQAPKVANYPEFFVKNGWRDVAANDGVSGSVSIEELYIAFVERMKADLVVQCPAHQGVLVDKDS